MIKFIVLLCKEDINCLMCVYQVYQIRSEVIFLIYVNEVVVIIDFFDLVLFFSGM